MPVITEFSIRFGTKGSYGDGDEKPVACSQDEKTRLDLEVSDAGLL